MNEILAALLAWTVANTPYEPPADPPTVEFHGASAFAERACPSEARCAARGYYEDGTGRIVLHESYGELSNVQQRAVVVHELVHYLQDLSGRFAGREDLRGVARPRAGGVPRAAALHDARAA